MSANAAIYFEPEGYSISGPRLMGRNAAGYGFLNGFFRHAEVDHFVGVSTNPAHAAPFRALATKAAVHQPVSMVHPNDTKALKDIGCVFMPGPGLGDQARLRSLFDRRAYSLCGVTHTLLSDRVMEALCATLTDPIEEWDAIICTSTVARDTINTVMGAEYERLKNRLGATKCPKPQLPVIPLGVDCSRFQISSDRKAQARARLGFGPDEVIVLYVGRLSFHAKAHPIAMYQALAHASKGASVRLVEYGKFFNDPIRQSFDELWTVFAPNIKRTVLDGASFELGEEAWAAADMFCSLSDNFQETFGLTPVEAMAAGLPVLVSDWNGYRNTVRHSIDGFRITTLTPKAGFGTELVNRYARSEDDYDHYCGVTSMAVALDMNELISSLHVLIHNATLRKTMGDAGRAHALATYDWRHIIHRYQELWKDLDARRNHASGESRAYYPWPARLDPFEAFQTYATRHLNHTTKLIRRDTWTKADLDQILALKSMALAARLLPSRDHFFQIIDQFTPDTPKALEDLKLDDGLTERDQIACLIIGLKIGALALASPSDQNN